MFPCSRFILGARSKVFSDIFAASTEADKKDDKATLEVEDCTPEVMELFLQLLYSNKAKIGDDNGR